MDDDQGARRVVTGPRGVGLRGARDALGYLGKSKCDVSGKSNS